MIVPAPNDVSRSAELVTLVAVSAESVESFKNWIEPNLPKKFEDVGFKFNAGI